MTIAIIYHDADFDGKLSNEVCRYWLKKLYPEAKIHSYGWDYGRPVPEPSREIDTAHSHNGGLMTRMAVWEDYDQIYIVDLSVDELMANPDLRTKIVWIDHHKSAIEKWVQQGDKKYGFQFTGYRIDGVAACRLCWQWFFTAQLDAQDGGEGRFTLPIKEHYINRSVSEPELLRLAGEYDIWDHRDPDAKALQFGLRCCNESELANLVVGQFIGTPESDGVLRNVIEGGRMVKSYCDKQNDEYAAAFSRTIQWEGLTFCTLNIGQRGNSDLLRGGLEPEHDACFAWRWTGDAVMVSLYHAPGKEHHDLSVIATKYGGGGHKGACGFRLSLAQLESIITPK